MADQTGTPGHRGKAFKSKLRPEPADFISGGSRFWKETVAGMKRLPPKSVPAVQEQISPHLPINL